MSNIILLCHGEVMEFRTFELLNENQTVDYRGNFGSDLPVSAAINLLTSLMQDPTITDSQIQKSIPNYQGGANISGPNNTGDIRLWGDDNLFCCAINMNTSQYAVLNSQWQSTLGMVVQHFIAQPYWINLICCTNLPGSNVPSPIVNSDLAVTDWSKIFG